MTDFDPNKFLEPSEQLLLTCTKPELTELSSFIGSLIGLKKDSQVRDQGDYYGHHGKWKAKPNLLHVDSDILLITDKRFLMRPKLGAFGFRRSRQASTNHITILQFDMYLDKNYALQAAQEIQVKNEEAAHNASAAWRDSSSLKKIGYHWGVGVNQFRAETYGYRPIPPILTGVQKVKPLLHKEELELKIDPVPVTKSKQFENPEWSKKYEEMASRWPSLSKEVFSLKIKEKDKLEDLYQILKQKADENQDFIQNEPDSQ